MASTTEQQRASTAVGPVRRAEALGWASAALGAPMVLAPRRLLQEIGLRPDGKAIACTLGVGVREFTATMTINVMHHRRVGAWARVAGDLMDLTLLARAFSSKRVNSRRLLGAGGFVAGILAADFVTAMQLGRAEGAHLPEGAGSHGTGADHSPKPGPSRLRHSVTVLKPEEEVRRAFREFPWSAFEAASAEARGEVRFVAAPGDRGVELHVEHDTRMPAVGALALKISGRAPDQRTSDELRRFKALLETGVEVRSDKSPEGPSTPRQMMQRPGHPVEVSA